MQNLKVGAPTNESSGCAGAPDQSKRPRAEENLAKSLLKPNRLLHLRSAHVLLEGAQHEIAGRQ